MLFLRNFDKLSAQECLLAFLLSFDVVIRFIGHASNASKRFFRSSKAAPWRGSWRGMRPGERWRRSTPREVSLPTIEREFGTDHLFLYRDSMRWEPLRCAPFVAPQMRCTDNVTVRSTAVVPPTRLRKYQRRTILAPLPIATQTTFWPPRRSTSSLLVSPAPSKPLLTKLP